MAGHSKWANIRFRKGVQDAKRGKIFTKLIREISVAARMGGADEASNPRLRDAVSKALKANMKSDTIDNAIKRGAGNQEGTHLVEMRYEGYGPGGAAVLVDCLSDNKNRTVSEVRHAFSKFGGNLGTDGSVAYLFQKQGEILLAPLHNEEEVIEALIEAGVEDIIQEDGQIEIVTSEGGYHRILADLEAQNIAIEHSRIAMNAQTTVPVNQDTAETIEKLIDQLEDLDDVQAVYCNAEYPDSFFSPDNA